MKCPQIPKRTCFVPRMPLVWCGHDFKAQWMMHAQRMHWPLRWPNLSMLFTGLTYFHPTHFSSSVPVAVRRAVPLHHLLGPGWMWKLPPHHQVALPRPGASQSSRAMHLPPGFVTLTLGICGGCWRGPVKTFNYNLPLLSSSLGTFLVNNLIKPWK